MANKVIPQPLWDAANMMCPVANVPETTPQTICVRMSSREYYSGELEMELPLGITQEDIYSIESEGYGEFGVYLTESGMAKTAHIHTEKYHEWSSMEWGHISDEWKLGRYDKTVLLMPTYEAAMEFCEVDANLIDDWEVTDG